MDFEAKLTEVMKQAMKTGDKPRLMAARALKSVLTTERTRHSGPLPEEAALQAIQSHRKKMAGALEQYREAGRDDLAQSAEAEIAMCDELLPPPLSDEELDTLVREQIERTGASSPKEMGKVMGPLMKELKGRVDGNRVRDMVGKLLGG